MAFLDLLGFKSQVEAAEADSSAHAKPVEILFLVKESLCESPALDFRLNYFSDCIVLSADRSAQGLWEMFNSICTLTSNLMQHDVLLRGGLTAGPVHHSKQFLFGSALNRAYEMESKKAIDPIVIISDEVLDDAKRYGDRHMCWLMEDRTRWFVHFFLEYAVYRPTPIYAGKVVLDRPGQRIMNFIAQRLNKDQGAVRAKAEWLRAYWNKTVAAHGTFGTIEEGVPVRTDLGGPTIRVRRLYRHC